MTVSASIATLRDRLADLADEMPVVPATARQGAVLVLLTERDDGSVDILYTLRQTNLSSHPGQISFPGGRVDPGETVTEAALREAAEEVGLQPESVEVLGQLPAFYIPPSRFWMSAVVGVWRQPHPLTPSPVEVAEILLTSSDTLATPERWRAVPLSAAGTTWAWHLSHERLLWGATAVVTGVVMDMVCAGWSGGVQPGDLTGDHVVRPWEREGAAGRSGPGPRAQLIDVETVEVPRPDAAALEPGAPASAARMDIWAEGVAAAVRRLRRPGPGPVVVLAGPGRIGTVGRLAADRLRADGRDVQVIDVRDGATPEVLATAGVIVDAMLGRGLRGLLIDPILDVVRALRAVSAPIVAVDLPTGIHPRDGLVGEAISADVTVSDSLLVPGHVAGGAMPFVADLYVISGDSSDDVTVRRAAVVDRQTTWGE